MMVYFDFTSKPQDKPLPDKKKQGGEKVKLLTPEDLPSDEAQTVQTQEALKILSPSDLPEDTQNKPLYLYPRSGLSQQEWRGFQESAHSPEEKVALDRAFFKRHSLPDPQKSPLKTTDLRVGPSPDALDTYYQDGGANKKDFVRDVFKFSKLLMRPLEGSVASVPVAINAFLQAMGPEAQQKFFTELAQSAREQALGVPEAQAAGQEVDAAAAATEKSRTQLKDLFRQLNEAPEMHSNISILALVLMSLIMGPKLAAALFVRKSQNGTLKYEFQMMLQEVKSREMEERQAQREYARAKRDVAKNRAMMEMENLRATNRSAEYDRRREAGMEDYKTKLMMRAENSFDLFELKQRARINKPSDDPAVQKVEKAFSRALSIGKLASFNGDEDQVNAALTLLKELDVVIDNARDAVGTQNATRTTSPATAK